MSCRRTRRPVRIPVFRTCTIWPGNSPTCSGASPVPPCWTAITPNDIRSGGTSPTNPACASRVPHRFLPDGRSTLDVPSTGFALLTGPAGQPWRAPSAPVEVYELDRAWCAVAGITDSGALLVRPDQIVAWRSPGLPPDPAAALRSALDRVLCA
ncbi:hypothetical protein [Nocardia wallacei]|uniref:aromatic-ring hydroxylase C-terminal domain-containing protein n=1 Tax=Nocardia wallacei TaxID=480035 RepID=UPI003CC7C49B